MCNDKLRPRKSLLHLHNACNVPNFANMSKLLEKRPLKYYLSFLFYFGGWSIEGVRMGSGP